MMWIEIVQSENRGKNNRNSLRMAVAQKELKVDPIYAVFVLSKVSSYVDEYLR